MTSPLESAPARRRFRFGRLLGTVLLLLVIVLVGLRLWASTLITRAVNGQLPRYLSAPASLGGVDLGLWSGQVSLRDLVIQQPAGFTGEPLLRLPLVRVRVKPSTLTQPVIEVEDITVDGLHAHLIQRKDGTNALLNAVAMLIPQPPPPAAPAEPASPAKPSPRVHIQSIRFTNLGLRYEDGTQGDKPLSITLTNLTLNVNGLLLDPSGASAPSAAHALARLDFEIPQVERPAAKLMASARIGAISTNVPNLNAVARLTGFSLTNAGPFLVSGVETVLGGEALDLRLDAAVAGEQLRVQLALAMTNGHVWPIRVTGTLQAPIVDKGALTGAVLNRPLRSARNLVGNVSGAMASATTEAGKAVGSAVGGALNTVSTVGGGLLSSAGKLLTGDAKGAAGALGRTVTDGTSAAVGTVTGTTGAFVDGVSQAGATALGSTRSADWWKAVPDRAEAADREATGALQAMPFPWVDP